MRFVLCLIVALCSTLAADAGPFRRSAGCSGGICAVMPSPVVPDNAKPPFSPLDLVTVQKAERVVFPAEPVAVQPQACAGGQCIASPANRFGRVTVRVFRR